MSYFRFAWWCLLKLAHIPVYNYCKRCGHRAEAFTVDDGTYLRAVPDGRERCFRCFDAGFRSNVGWPVWRVTLEPGSKSRLVP